MLPGFRAKAIEGTSQAYLFYRPVAAGTDSAFLEVAWQVNPASISYYRNGALLESQLLVQTVISGPDDFILKDAFLAATPPFSPGATTLPPVYFRQRYALPAEGLYYLTLRVSEKEKPENHIVFEDSVIVTLDKSPRFSSMQILDTSYQPQASGPYTKAGMERLARPLAFADARQLNLQYYSELYHLPADPAILQVSIGRKRKSPPLAGLLRTDTLQQASSLYPITGHFDLKALPSGNYYLNEILSDTLGKTLAEQQLFFQISNPDPAVQETSGWDTAAMNMPLKFLDISKTFVAKYSDEEKRAILKMLLPIADETEAANIHTMLRKGSDPLHTAYFIYNFFQKRNASKPEAAWKEYASRVREVNKLFSEPGRMGYETDRGTVYLKYGNPDERLRVPAETGALPYEVWRYNQNPAIPQLSFFLFYQDGFTVGEYRLLHSTVPGQTYNARWGEILYKGDTEKLKNSRAWRLMNNE